MSAATALRPARRAVRFESLEELLADAERVAGSPHVTVGSWSCGQILWHVATAMNGSFDGFGFRAPWPVRALAPLFKRRLLRGPFPASVKLTRSSAKLLPPADVCVPDGLALLRAAVARFATETPAQPHPVFGRMQPDETLRLHLRHAELHLSFVVPHGGQPLEA